MVNAIQTIVLLLGAFLIIIAGFTSAPEGIGQGFQALQEGGMMLNKDFFSMDLAKISIWTNAYRWICKLYLLICRKPRYRSKIQYN